jgi:hypothetical protein
MAALDKYLITKDDVLVYRPTADLDSKTFDTYILEAQRLDLKPVLNDALYFDFMSKFDAEGDAMYDEYQNLLNGAEYEYQGNPIQFDGIKPMLCYYALARFVENNPAQIVRFGVVVKTNPNSTPADSRQVQGLANSLRSAAISYQYQVIKYLEENASTFTLYNTGGGSEQSARSTSFNFFKA